MEVTGKDVKKLNDLLQEASVNGFDSALEQFGEAINGREARAFESLAPEDLKAFAKIYDKVIKAAYGNQEAAGADWACGAVC